MTRAAQTILDQALRLEPDARMEIIARLLGSLEELADADASTAWALEIERRVESIESGAESLELWADVRSRIERGILNDGIHGGEVRHQSRGPVISSGRTHWSN